MKLLNAPKFTDPCSFRRQMPGLKLAQERNALVLLLRTSGLKTTRPSSLSNNYGGLISIGARTVEQVTRIPERLNDGPLTQMPGQITDGIWEPDRDKSPFYKCHS